MKLILPTILLVFISCSSSFKSRSSTNIFDSWKMNAMEKLRTTCDENMDDFYQNECELLEYILTNADPNLIDSIYSSSIQKFSTKTDEKLVMEFYLRYHYSGEYNDVWDIFVFNATTGYFISRYSHFKNVIKISKTSTLDNRIFGSSLSSEDHSENLLCGHSIVCTRFSGNIPKETNIALCPHVTYFNKINNLGK